MSPERPRLITYPAKTANTNTTNSTAAAKYGPKLAHPSRVNATGSPYPFPSRCDKMTSEMGPADPDGNHQDHHQYLEEEASVGEVPNE